MIIKRKRVNSLLDTSVEVQRTPAQEKRHKVAKRVKSFLKKYGRLMIGGTILAVVVFCSICAPLLTDQDPTLVVLANSKRLPDAEHILGCDQYGRDIWARLLYGSRTTLLVVIGAQIVSVVGGTVLGLLCGYYRKVEKVLMRILEGFATIPNLLLCLMMVSIFGAGTLNLILAMSIGGIPGCARIVRSQVLSLKEKEYIESEMAMGASDVRTMFLHILPSCVSFLIVRVTTGLSGSMLSITSLSYLGLGLDPLIPSWGGEIQQAQSYMFTVPHMVLYPALAICITIFGFSMLGDAVRDLLDPKLR
jgi:ABC-type dipeptide/oligopeptide/nickel transport system permease subunit